MAEFNDDMIEPKEEAERELVSFVVEHCDKWRDHRDVNYLQKWDEYERLFRGEWAAEDKMRESERSRIVTPALQQAIEGKQAEISEAVFGRGEWFDIQDDNMDQQPEDIALVRNQMHEDFKYSKIKKAVDSVILLAELYGTGIGEITVSEKNIYAPATQSMEGEQAAMIGVMEKSQFMVGLNPINPRNFLIEPNATTVEDSLGVAIEEYMSLHTIVEGMMKGIYRKVDIQASYDTMDIERTQEDVVYRDGKVRVVRYYGKVPREYLNGVEEITDIFTGEADDYQDLVEAIIVIADDQYLLKAEESPYMMKDRPVVAYQADTMPGRFWGRGTAEKGYNMQKAIDAQIRSHLDSLALTTAPMMAMDATRLPRGAKYEVKAGKNLLVNGNPNEIMMPFKFGNTDPANMQTASTFQSMLLQATGTMDSAAMPGQVAGGEASGAGLSMALSGLMKKNKRTLINFQEDFLMPLIQKSAWRFMQFDPERYPVQDFKFICLSTLGMVAREYEQQQMVGLMQTLGNSPITPVLLQGIVKSSSLSNREDIVAALKQMSEPDPQQQQLQQQKMQLELAQQAALVARTEAEAARAQAEAQQAQANAAKAIEEAQAVVPNLQIKAMSAMKPSNQVPAEFQMRKDIATLALKEQDSASNERIAMVQMANKLK
jgi:citrate lyase gamma subunit